MKIGEGMISILKGRNHKLHAEEEMNMQVLVLFHSKGGNTRKLAERIGEGIESVQGIKALLRSTQEVTKEDFVNSAGVPKSTASG